MCETLQTFVEHVNECKNGKYRRSMQILNDRLPLLYMKFGEDILDDSIEFRTHKREIGIVRKIMRVIERDFFDDYIYIIDEILQYVRGGLLDIPVNEIGLNPHHEYHGHIYSVNTLLKELDIDRFNTILDIGTGYGFFIELSILANKSKYVIGVDFENTSGFCGTPQQFGEVMSRVEYRSEDGLKTNYDLPENSLVTSFYMNKGGNFFHLVDTAIQNNACLIVKGYYADAIVKNAHKNGMKIIDDSNNFFNKGVIAIPKDW